MIYETGVIVKPKRKYEPAKKENTSISTSLSSHSGVPKKQSIVEMKTTDKNVITPNTVQEKSIVNGRRETDLALLKLNKVLKVNSKDKIKNVPIPIVIMQDENGTIVEKNSLEVKKINQKINNVENSDNLYTDNSTTRKVFISPITSFKKNAIAKPSIIDIPLKEFLFPTISTSPNSALSKNKKSSPVFKPFWSLTAFVSNEWGEYKLDNDEHDNTGNQQDEKEEISRREKHEGSYAVGLFATRQFSKHIGLKTGLIYTNTAINISPQEVYAAKKMDGSVAYKYITSSGYGFVKPGFGLPPAVGDSIQSTMAHHNLQVISVPLMVLYRFEKKKFSFSPAVGLSANFITSASINTEVTDALNKEAITINGLDGMNNFYTGLIADVNLLYNYNSNLSFSFLPGFKYALTPITRSNVVKTFPYSFSIGVGITYKF